MTVAPIGTSRRVDVPIMVVPSLAAGRRMIPRLRCSHLRSVAPRALLPGEQLGDMGMTQMISPGAGEARLHDADVSTHQPGIGSVMLRSALTTMMLLCGGLAGAQEIGDCGHPVPERSI